MRPFLRVRISDIWSRHMAIAFIASFILSVLALYSIEVVLPLFLKYGEIEQLREGDASPKEIISPRSIVVNNRKAFFEERTKVLRKTPIVLYFDETVSFEVLQDAEETLLPLRHLLVEERYEEVRDILNDRIPGVSWEEINDSDFAKIIEESLNCISKVMEEGLIFKREFVEDARAEITPTKGREREIIPIKSLPSEESLSEYLFPEDKRKRSASEISTIITVVKAFIRPNMLFDLTQTIERQKKAIDSIDKHKERIRRGDVVIREGEVLTREDRELLQRLFSWTLDAFFPLVELGGILLFLHGYALLLSRKLSLFKNTKNRDLIMILGISLFYIIVVAFCVQSSFLEHIIASAIIPFAFFVFLLHFLFSPKEALLILHLYALFSLMYIRDISVFITLTATGVTGSFLVNKIEKRMEPLIAGLAIGFVNAAFIFIETLIDNVSTPAILVVSGIAAIVNPFLCAIITVSLLPVFEHFFNYCTPFRLQELSDTNNSLLKKLFNRAPGTYIHSLNVANLAEAACRRIGGNALLARVGGLYHDIGKTDQPEYFTENQIGENKHDDLKNTLSVAVIKSHVKLGVEKANEKKLPQPVIDIIQQHHGTELIRYFYTQAQKNKSKQDVEKNDYSYSGPNPQTKEAAVVFFADAAEAVTRSIKHINPAKLDVTIWEILMERVSREVINSTSLTFKELGIIKESFVHILSAQAHTRIQYPELSGKAPK